MTSSRYPDRTLETDHVVAIVRRDDRDSVQRADHLDIANRVQIVDSDIVSALDVKDVPLTVVGSRVDAGLVVVLEPYV